MADRENQPVILVGADAAQEQNRRLAEESKKLIESRGGKRLDETVPGGWFIGADGVPHDSEGHKLDAPGVKAAGKVEDPEARLRELEAEMAVLRSRVALGAGVMAATQREGLVQTAWGTVEGVSPEAKEAGQEPPPDESILGVERDVERQQKEQERARKDADKAAAKGEKKR